MSSERDERRLLLPISNAQADLLVSAQRELGVAQLQVDTLLKMVLAQHSVPQGRILEITDTTPRQLVVMVPEPNGTGKEQG